VVLFLHNRYRTTGGEERAVADLLRLVREELAEPAELLTRDSARLGRGAAALGLLRGGSAPADVGRAVRLAGARVVHAHNLLPAFGWRALAAARAAGARVVLHLHQYRLVCAVGVCFTRGQECTRCHGRNTLPGVALACRGSRAEALTYGAALALWQRRLVEQADAVLVPSEFARARLHELGAPLDAVDVRVMPPPVWVPDPGGAQRERYALVVSRLAPEKGVDLAIEACRLAGRPLVVAGDGPERAALEARAVGADVRFAGALDERELAPLRSAAAVSLAPSRSAETFGLAAAEAMAAGVPTIAARVGALPELVAEPGWLVPPGDARALAAAMEAAAGDAEAGERARERVRALCAPGRVAPLLGDVYDG
jgi:glycosyltransferase involved in cell wall biosynthesis